MFQYNMIPTTNKPTHIMRDAVTTIDQIVANTIINGIQDRSGIIKLIFQIIFQSSLRLIHVKKVSQKIRHNLFINPSTENNK